MDDYKLPPGPPPAYTHQSYQHPPPASYPHQAELTPNYPHQPNLTPQFSHSNIARAPSPISSTQPTSKPIAIPATSHQTGSPFLRAYPPILTRYSIPRDIFLNFLDDLNRVAVANPPLQILSLAGNIVSLVPVPPAGIVGFAVGTGAQVATKVVSKGRTEMFLREANKERFGPRGLKIELGRLDALAKLAGIPILNAKGEIDKHQTLLAPVVSQGMGTENSLSGQERRLQSLRPWIEELEVVGLPDVKQPDNSFSKFTQGASERMRKRGEKKMLKERAKAEEDYREELQKVEEDYRKDVGKNPAKAERKFQEEMAKIEKDRVKDDKEEEMLRKILWLIIRPVDPSKALDDEFPVAGAEEVVAD